MTVLCDQAEGHIVHVADGRSAEAVEEYASDFDEEARRAVETVAMDIWQAFINAVEKLIPAPRRRSALTRRAIYFHLGDLNMNPERSSPSFPHWELLAQVSRYPALVPRPVREELASRIARHWPIPAAESLRAIETSEPMPRAASRRHPYPPPPSTFEELLECSSLTARQRSLWAEVAGG